MLKKKRGFTLIELIVVIAIIAILAMLAVPQYNKLKEQSAKEIAIANAHSVYIAAVVLETSGQEINEKALAEYLPGEYDNYSFLYAVKDGNKIRADWQGWIGNKIYYATYSSNGETTVEEIDSKSEILY